VRGTSQVFGGLGVGASLGNGCDATSQTIESLLVPTYRIIAKNVKCIDLENIDRHHKRANQIALNHFLREIVRNCYSDLLLECFRDYYCVNEKVNLTIDMLKEGGQLLAPPIEVVSELNNRKISVRNEALINSSKRMFSFYKRHLEREYQCIFITGATSEDNTNKKTIMKLETRYSNSYRKKVEKRMKWLCYKYGNSQAVLLTLTIDPKIYNNDKLRMWQDIKNQYHRFITALKYHFKKSGRVFPKYLCSIESQKNGNPHLHIVFLGASRLIDWRTISNLWHQGFIFINRTNGKQKIRYPINYVTKYITKTFCETTDKNLLTQSISWLFNIRSYSCSRGLVFPLKPKSTGEWIANGLIIVNKKVSMDFLLSNIDLVNRYMNPLDPLFKNHWI